VYYDYPTGTDDIPSNAILDPDPGNNANFYDYGGTGYANAGSYKTTEVGEYENSVSPYGTFDQGGNEWEWNETEFDPDHRYVSGGSAFTPVGHTSLRADSYGYNGPVTTN